MIEKSKRRFLCIKFRACGLSFSEGIVLLVIGYSRYSNQETISSLSGIDKYQMPIGPRFRNRTLGTLRYIPVHFRKKCPIYIKK